MIFITGSTISAEVEDTCLSKQTRFSREESKVFFLFSVFRDFLHNQRMYKAYPWVTNCNRVLCSKFTNSLSPGTFVCLELVVRFLFELIQGQIKGKITFVS